MHAKWGPMVRELVVQNHYCVKSTFQYIQERLPKKDHNSIVKACLQYHCNAHRITAKPYEWSLDAFQEWYEALQANRPRPQRLLELPDLPLHLAPHLTLAAFNLKDKREWDENEWGRMQYDDNRRELYKHLVALFTIETQRYQAGLRKLGPAPTPAELRLFADEVGAYQEQQREDWEKRSSLQHMEQVVQECEAWQAQQQADDEVERQWQLVQAAKQERATRGVGLRSLRAMLEVRMAQFKAAQAEARSRLQRRIARDGVDDRTDQEAVRDLAVLGEAEYLAAAQEALRMFRVAQEVQATIARKKEEQTRTAQKKEARLAKVRLEMTRLRERDRADEKRMAEGRINDEEDLAPCPVPLRREEGQPAPKRRKLTPSATPPRDSGSDGSSSENDNGEWERQKAEQASADLQARAEVRAALERENATWIEAREAMSARGAAASEPVDLASQARVQKSRKLAAQLDQLLAPRPPPRDRLVPV